MWASSKGVVNIDETAEVEDTYDVLVGTLESGNYTIPSDGIYEIEVAYNSDSKYTKFCPTIYVNAEVAKGMGDCHSRLKGYFKTGDVVNIRVKTEHVCNPDSNYCKCVAGKGTDAHWSVTKIG